MVAKFAVKPDASEAAMPITCGIAAAGTCISRAQAAAAPSTPTMPVECQPSNIGPSWSARTIRAATSAPMMKADTISAGVALVVSATGRIAGITAAIACARI